MNGLHMKDEKTTRFRKDIRSLKRAPISFLIPIGALFQSSLQQGKLNEARKQREPGRGGSWGVHPTSAPGLQKGGAKPLWRTLFCAG